MTPSRAHTAADAADPAQLLLRLNKRPVKRTVRWGRVTPRYRCCGCDWILWTL